MADELQLEQAQGHEARPGPAANKLLLALSCILLALGNCGGPQLMRLYFLHGGNRLWFTSWLETGGWPVILIPLTLRYLHNRRGGDQAENKTKFFTMNPRLFVGSALIGLLTGLDDYLYAFGVARLPLSTLSLVIASHLAFTAFFAFLLVKQKFTSYSINAVVLLVVGSAVLGLNTASDRPPGVSENAYLAGFFMTVAAAALYGLVLPAVELMYRKARQVVTYGLVVEVQLVMCFFATLLCTVGMLINKDFQAIPREAKEYGLGEMKYYTVVVWNAILWQCFFLGAIGVIFCASSLLSGVIIAVLLPFTEILAVIIFREKFQAEKGVALVLSLWGFVSYFYGEMKYSKKKKRKVVQNSLGSV
uniref:Probable purine permease n=1 Tax=Kalanchoe fedtschenkoi TaxID=63787 RepID=A0A7N0TR45_KALFE